MNERLIDLTITWDDPALADPKDPSGLTEDGLICLADALASVGFYIDNGPTRRSATPLLRPARQARAHLPGHSMTNPDGD